jgi:hypothetical protein
LLKRSKPSVQNAATTLKPYGIAADGTLNFDSGATYTRAEQAKLEHLDTKTKLDVHNIKKTFTGATLQ